MQSLKNDKTQRMAYAGVLLALCVLLPQVLHFAPIPQAGNVFLPMHIPVFIAGFVLGPVYGAAIGALAPFISSVTMGMPSIARMPFMVIELFVYGFMCGVLYHKLKLCNKKGGVYISLIVSMIIGRLSYALALSIAFYLFNIPCGGPIAAFTATVTGVPGMLIQLIIVPMIVYLLKRSGFLINDGKLVNDNKPVNTNKSTDINQSLTDNVEHADLMKAKEIISTKGVTFCAILPNGEKVTSDQRGIAPMMKILEESPEKMRGAAVADRVIGKAAAFLLLLLKAECLYTELISTHAKELLLKHGMHLYYKKEVTYIINRKGDGMCPMEQSVLNEESPEKAYMILKEKFAQMEKMKP